MESVERSAAPIHSRHLRPEARDTLRRILIRDDADRNAIASHLPRDRDERGNDRTDIIDMLTMDPGGAAEGLW